MSGNENVTNISERKSISTEEKPDNGLVKLEVAEPASTADDVLSRSSSPNCEKNDDASDEQAPRSFPQKLMDILSDESHADIVSWCPHGNGFLIHKKKLFASEILPKFFKASKFTSFTRKLNRWGFNRVPRGPETGAYYHKLFRRDKPDLCSQMTSNSGSKYQSTPMQQHLLPNMPIPGPFGMYPGMPGMPPMFPYMAPPMTPPMMGNMNPQQQQALWHQQMQHMMQMQQMQMMQMHQQMQQVAPTPGSGGAMSFNSNQQESKDDEQNVPSTISINATTDGMPALDSVETPTDTPVKSEMV